VEKRVVFRDRQELQAADTNNVQEFVATSLQHICQDTVGTGLFYSGLQTSLQSQTEIKIGSGRFWQNGKVYTRDVDATQATLQSDIFSLFNFLPTTHKRLIAVLAFGEEIQTDVQPRDFLINLETGATEPQAVPMQSLRLCNINLLPGVESPVPQMPVVPAGTILVATVTLSTTGITSIEMSSSGRMPNTSNIQINIDQILLWKALIEPIINSIRSDLAALWDAVGRAPNKDFMLAMAADIAWLKEKQQVGDNFSNYAADIFDTADESDTANVAYSALVLDGLRFATEAQTTMNVALFNPSDPNVARRDNLILPKYENVKRFSTSNYAGEFSLTYQFQTINYSVSAGFSYSYRYGWSLQVSRRWWTAGYLRASAEVALDIQIPGLYYHYVWNSSVSWGAAQQITGSLVSQTILISNAMWLTQVGLFFTAIGATGDVTLVISETNHGKPDLSKTYTTVTIPRADLKQYPIETMVQIPPVFLKAGVRYAFTLITQGNHRVAVAASANTYSASNPLDSVTVTVGNNAGAYTEGTLFTGTDGDYFVGDLTKDLMISLYAAKFTQTRTEIPLQSLSLAGGMTNISIDSKQVIPDGCEVHFEFQKDGIWRRMGDPTFYLQSKPDLVPIRAVLIGTSDLAPQIELKTNGLKGWRSLTTYTHLSTLRTLAAASASITVKVDVYNFVPANHTLTCQLRKTDNSLVNATTTTSTDEGDGIRRFKFTFALSPTLTQYRVQLNGGRSSANVQPFVTLSRVDVAA
jgi:hypothetical protein